MDETRSPELATLILRDYLLGTTVPDLGQRLPPPHILRQLAAMPWGPPVAHELLTLDPPPPARRWSAAP